jgi:hypothetical protein
MRTTLLAAIAACLSFGAGCASPVMLGTTVTDAQLDEATTVNNVAYYTDLSMYQGDHALKRLGVVTLHSGHSRDAMRAAEGQEGALEGVLTGFVEQLAGSTPKVEVVRPEDMEKTAAVAAWGPPGGAHHAPSSRLIGLAFGDDDECAAVCREAETDGVFMISVAPARTVLVIMIPFARFKVADPDGIHPVDFNHTMTLRLDHDGALGSGEELGRLLGRAFHRFLYPSGV